VNPTPRTSIKVFGTVSLGTNSIRLIHVSMSTSAMYKHDTFHHIVCVLMLSLTAVVLFMYSIVSTNR